MIAELQDLKDFLSRSGIDDDAKRIALATIWTQDEIHDIQNVEQLEKYTQIIQSIEKDAPPVKTIEYAKWCHTNEGILANAYRVKVYAWTDRGS